MSQSLQAGYRRALEPWCRFASNRLHRTAPDSLCYGIGSHGHWSLQAHDTAFAAFAALAADPGLDPARAGFSRDELTATALAMLRFTLRSHLANGGACTDGQPWGHSWISALGLERLMHGVEALEPVLAPDLKAMWRALLTSEADWLLADYPVKAGLVKDNKPESNLWNGALLQRTALLFPDSPRAAAWREKGTVFLLNSISIPADAGSDAVFAGKPLRDRHAGANFFPSFACNHHGYLNVGYMVICLSNLALFYFACRTRGWPVPPELEWHARELWRLVSSCTFPDGRLLRIGGDTRVRYAYCQDYAIPLWLYARDRFGDPVAERHEAGWLGQVERERNGNADGSFMGGRLGRLRDTSPNYYLRLEGDKACTLSMGLYWRRTLPGFPAAPEATPEPPLTRWEDDHHGAFFHRSPKRFASWVWEAAEKPQGLCLPPDASTWAEWRTNLAGRVLGVGKLNAHAVRRRFGFTFEGGFATAGRLAVQTSAFISEGDLDEEIATLDLVFAALPDGATVVVLQRARTLHLAYLREWKSLLLQIGNDVMNGFKRRFAWEGGARTFRAPPRKAGRMVLNSRWINVENRMGAAILYGSDSFILNRPAERQITIKDYPSRTHTSDGGGSLYAEEILLHDENGVRAVDGNTVLFDIGCALRCGEKRAATAARAMAAVAVAAKDDLRVVRLAGADKAPYLLAANLGDEAQVVEPPPGAWTDCRTGLPAFPGGRLALDPGQVALARGDS
jgi:hypothetical protein